MNVPRIPTIQHLTFGIVIDDIVMPDGTTYSGILGGGGPQTAWGMAAASGDGSTIGLVAQVGADADLTPMINAGVNLDGVRWSLPATPRAWQQIDAEGHRTHTWKVPPVAPPVGWSYLPEHYFAARGFHWGLHPENPDLSFARELVSLGRQVSLETFKPPDHTLSDEELRALVTACTIFSPNWREAVGLTGTRDYHEVLRRFKACGCKILALRRGAEGAEIWDLERGEGVRVPAVPTTVVDTVGAGNAFCGALLVTLDQGLTRAAAHAVTAASYLVEQVGIPVQLPDRDDYEQRFAWALNQALTLRLPDAE